jgi:anaerobic selenocysteine-containing dehydrogenase
VIRFADGRFPTPSGRVEIASASAEANGHPRVPQPHADARPSDGRFRLLSPANEWLMNDSYANDANVLRKLGPACIQLNPEDAKALALEEGEVASVSSRTGRIELRVRCSDRVPRGVALAHKGRWPRLEAGASNVNALNAGERSDMGESSSVHGTLVRIAAA